MKSLLKRNQIMITALAIMIAIAGYLQFAGNKLEAEEVALTSGENVTNDTIGILDISEEDNLEANLVEIESLDTDINMAETDYPEDTMEVAGNEMEIVTDELAAADTDPLADGEIPGEAVFTSSTNVNTLSGAKLLKEQTRAKNKETLLEIIDSATIENEQKQEAIDHMIALTDIAEKETAAEILLETKGFSNAVVSISDGSVDVIVNEEELSDAMRAQIEDIVKRKTGVSAENIIITPMSSK